MPRRVREIITEERVDETEDETGILVQGAGAGCHHQTQVVTSGEMVSSVYRTLVTMVVPCPPVSRDRVNMMEVAKKRFKLATRQTEPAVTIFSPENITGARIAARGRIMSWCKGS